MLYACGGGGGGGGDGARRVAVAADPDKRAQANSNAPILVLPTLVLECCIFFRSVRSCLILLFTSLSAASSCS